MREFAERILKAISKTYTEMGTCYVLNEDEESIGLMEAYELAVTYLAEHPEDDAVERNAEFACEERSIDDAMATAKRIFMQDENRHDPYAMHKAVESIPTIILQHLLAERSDSTLTPDVKPEQP